MEKSEMVLELTKKYSRKDLTLGCLLNRFKYNEDFGFEIDILIDCGEISKQGNSSFVHYLNNELQPYYFEDNIKFIEPKDLHKYNNLPTDSISRNYFEIIGHELLVTDILDIMTKNKIIYGLSNIENDTINGKNYLKVGNGGNTYIIDLLGKFQDQDIKFIEDIYTLLIDIYI